jgi:hypothetical protein
MSQLRTRQPIGNYEFEGPYQTTERVPEAEGLLAVITSDGRQNYLIDVIHTPDILASISDSPRRSCWDQYNKGILLYAFLRSDDLEAETYQSIERDIRTEMRNIPCK